MAMILLGFPMEKWVPAMCPTKPQGIVARGPGRAPPV